MGKTTYRFRKWVQSLIFPGMRRTIRKLQAGLAQAQADLAKTQLDAKEVRSELETVKSALDRREQELAAVLENIAGRLSALENARRQANQDDTPYELLKMAEDADRLFILGRHQEALQRVNEALVSDPACVGSWCRKINILIEMGETARAKDALRHALRNNPLHPLLRGLGASLKESQTASAPTFLQT
jgi:tetratricopeptide (TPR) repeat protein